MKEMVEEEENGKDKIRRERIVIKIIEKEDDENIKDEIIEIEGMMEWNLNKMVED